MTGSEIIKNFELLVDDQSNLSSLESLDLANKIYRQVIEDRPWEWLKKNATGTVSSSAATVPSDFKYFVENYEDSDGVFKPVIFVGTDNQPYIVVPFSQRRDYRNMDGYAYYDAVNNTINFMTSDADSKSFEFDYIYQPGDLTTANSPVFPARFHNIIPIGMAVDFAPIDNMPKNRSYQQEFQIQYEELLTNMRYENSKLYGGSSY